MAEIRRPDAHTIEQRRKERSRTKQRERRGSTAQDIREVYIEEVNRFARRK